tara:strand:- start:480 stop:617 length:138 start_codon:yes stop_codon:yes gene_type:complete
MSRVNESESAEITGAAESEDHANSESINPTKMERLATTDHQSAKL